MNFTKISKQIPTYYIFGYFSSWKFGEESGYSQLCRFLEEDVIHYEKESSRADMPWTAVISPYLHWGELSPRTVLHEALARGRDATKFRRKLAWRDMSYWILSLFPHMDTLPIRPQYEIQWWSQDKVHLKAWQKGNLWRCQICLKDVFYFFILIKHF